MRVANYTHSWIRNDLMRNACNAARSVPFDAPTKLLMVINVRVTAITDLHHSTRPLHLAPPSGYEAECTSQPSFSEYLCASVSSSCHLSVFCGTWKLLLATSSVFSCVRLPFWMRKMLTLLPPCRTSIWILALSGLTRFISLHLRTTFPALVTRRGKSGSDQRYWKYWRG